MITRQDDLIDSKRYKLIELTEKGKDLNKSSETKEVPGLRALSPLVCIARLSLFRGGARGETFALDSPCAADKKLRSAHCVHNQMLFGSGMINFGNKLRVADRRRNKQPTHCGAQRCALLDSTPSKSLARFCAS